MFDVDQDGILNLIEAQHVLRCVGFRANVEQVLNCTSAEAIGGEFSFFSFSEAHKPLALGRSYIPLSVK